MILRTKPSAAPAAPGVSASAMRVRPLRDAIATLVVMLVASLVCSAVLVERSRDALGDEIRDGLLRTAKLAAIQVDLAEHDALRDRAQEDTGEYLRATDRLARFQACDPDLAFVYTCVDRGDGIRFVLDPTPQGDRDGDGIDDKSHLMQNYPEAAPELVAALRDGVPTVSRGPYHDIWGSFMSGYAPLVDAMGRVHGVVGVDLTAAKFEARLSGVNDAFLLAEVVSFVLAVLTAIGVFLARRATVRAAARVGRLAADLETAQHAAHAGERAKSVFLANVSHEFRTPMNGLLGMSELLLGSGLNAEQREMAGSLHQSATAFTSILGDVLNLAQVSSGSIELVEAPFNPAELTHAVTSMFASAARERGLSLITKCPGHSQRALIGDGARVRQILLHLIDNAFKFTAHGMVTVSYDATIGADGRAFAVFSVADTGIGIPRAKFDTIFEPFEQVDGSASRRFGGAGVGLPIARRLARSMGGDITVESREGAGSRFQFAASFRVGELIEA